MAHLLNIEKIDTLAWDELTFRGETKIFWQGATRLTNNVFFFFGSGFVFNE